MSVFEYFPFDGKPHRWTMGIRNLNPEEWFQMVRIIQNIFRRGEGFWKPGMMRFFRRFQDPKQPARK